MGQTVHSAMARAIADLGVDTVFGLMGDANMAYIADLIESEEVRFVDAVIESSAVSMAVGHAQTTNSVGVATVTHGPGLTNALTTLVEAVRGEVPMVLLSGDLPSAMQRDHPQRFELASFADVAGAGYARVGTASQVIDDLRGAHKRALAERRPILLNIASDLMTEQVEYAPAPTPVVVPAAGIDPNSQAWDRALGLIASARRPLIVAGRGAALSGAHKALLDLGEAIGALFATSVLGKDFFDGDPHDLGLLGGMGTRTANELAAESDCIIAFGASLNRYTTSAGTLLDGRPVIHCDVDPSRIGRHGPVAAGLVGDARLVAEQMAEALHDVDLPRGAFRDDKVRARIENARFWSEDPPEPADGFVDMRTAVSHFDAVIPQDRSLVTDAGRFMRVPWRLMGVSDPLNFVHTLNFGSVGLGMSTALGVAFASGQRPTVLVIGDGGLMMNLVEFHTAVVHQLPLIVIVLNDGSYGAEYQKLPHFGHDPSHSLREWPSFADVATSLGGTGVTVRSVGDLEHADGLIAAESFPLLIDVRCDPAVDVAVE